MMTVRLERFHDAIFALGELTRGRLDVLADGALCASVAPRGDVEIVSVGGSRQPPACSREGATLELANGAGQTLFVTGTVRPGSTLVVTNFAPRPPHTEHTAAREAPARPATESVALGGPLFAAFALVLIAVCWARRRPGPAA